MMPTVWKYSYRFGAAVFLFMSTFWVPVSAHADAGTTEDLTQVRTLAEKGSIRDEIVLAGDYFIGKGASKTRRWQLTGTRRLPDMETPRPRTRLVTSTRPE